MLSPERMANILIAGPQDIFESTVDAVYGLNNIHIKEFHDPDDIMEYGTHFADADAISEKLVRLRGLRRLLGIDENITEKVFTISELLKNKEKIKAIEKHLLTLEKRKARLRSRKQELEQSVRNMAALADMPLSLDDYRGYKSLAVFVGHAPALDKAILAEVSPQYELFVSRRGEPTIAIFVPKENEEEVASYLSTKGFRELSIPQESGEPSVLHAGCKKELAAVIKEMGKARKEIESISKNNPDLILAAEEYLSMEIEIAESPQHFGVSKNTFVIEGWVPESEFEAARSALEKRFEGMLYIGRFGDDAIQTPPNPDSDTKCQVGSSGKARTAPKIVSEAGKKCEKQAAKDSNEDEDATPTKLKHSRLVRPYEFLLHLFSTPAYGEIDPTFLMFLVFPVFFGFMIGDIGYGVGLVAMSFVFKKIFPSDEARSIGNIVLVGGIVSMFFGFFVFGDMFGISFHSTHVVGHAGPEEITWESLGLYIPREAIIHKLETPGIMEMMTISIFAGFVHMGLGFILGAANDWKHNKKHAVAKMSWFVILLGITMIIMLKARYTAFGEFIGKYMLFDIHRNALSIPSILGTIEIPYASMGIIAVGLVIVVATEGGLAPMEILGRAANILSYTRLAAIAIAKGAMALAFNTMLLPLVLGGDIVYIIFGAFLLFMAHMLVLILGGLSSGIQALRLHYVEFFLKFYRGGGTLYTPFGHKGVHIHSEIEVAKKDTGPKPAPHNP